MKLDIFHKKGLNLTELAVVPCSQPVIHRKKRAHDNWPPTNPDVGDRLTDLEKKWQFQPNVCFKPNQNILVIHLLFS